MPDFSPYLHLYLLQLYLARVCSWRLLLMVLLLAHSAIILRGTLPERHCRYVPRTYMDAHRAYVV
jgi:hypothetical protein